MGVERTTEATEVTPNPISGTEPGAVLLDRYRVLSVIAIGGYGRVLKACDDMTGEIVAVKVLRDDVPLDDANVARFLREAQAVQRLRSEHVAHIRAVGSLGTAPVIVMEYLEGEDLAQVLAARGRVDVKFAAEVALHACDALAEAHASGIVHRDIKPANLFLAAAPGAARILKVLDFGISKVAEQSMALTQTMSVLGTPLYMSPEQTRSARTVDHRTDIWALGIVLYELVEGSPPFEGETFAEMCVLVATHEPRPMTHAPELARVVARCLAKDPEERYPHLAALAMDLAPFAPRGVSELYVPRVHRALSIELPRYDHLGVARTAPSLSQVTTAVQAPLSVRRRRLPIVVASAVLAVAAALATYTVLTNKERPPPAVPAIVTPRATEPAPPPSVPIQGSAVAPTAGSASALPAKKRPSKVRVAPRNTQPAGTKIEKATGSALPCDPAATPEGC